MPVHYKVDSNLLTDPPSHYPRVEPVETLDIDDLAELINLHNPTVPIGTAKECIDLFIEELKTQLIDGNWVKFDNFCSFSSSMTGGVLESPGDALPATTKVSLRFKPSATFVQEIRDNSSFQRDGYINKLPSIIGTKSELFGVNDIFTNDSALSLTGKDINLDPTDSETGVFLQVDGGLNAQQTNIARNKPSNLIIIPNSPDPTNGQVAARLSIKNRYTANGQVKESEYSRYIRMRNEAAVSIADTPIFKPFGSAAVVVLDTPATPISTLFTIKIDNLNKMFIYGASVVNSIVQEAGVATEITGAGDFVVVASGESITFGVADYQNLYDFVNSSGRFIQEYLVTSV